MNTTMENEIALIAEVKWYYFHDGVLEETTKFVDGASHIAVTIIRGIPKRADVITSKDDWFINQDWPK